MTTDLAELIATAGGILHLVNPLEEVEIHEADGIYIRETRAPQKDTLLTQHAHTWDHVTMISTGGVYLWRDGKLDGEFRAPCAVTIKAGVEHAFLTTEDNTVLLCIHSMHGKERFIED